MKKYLPAATLLAATLLSTTVFAGPAQAMQKNLDVLFIQSADGGSLMPIQGKTGYYQLQLNEVKDYIGYFSDRPARISGIYPTNQFITDWNSGSNPHSFNKVPPNAALNTVITGPFSKKMVSVPVQLSTPTYDATKHTINYTVQILPGSKAKLPLKNMGQTVLFIDSYCASCVGQGF